MSIERLRSSYDTVAVSYSQTWGALEAESPLEIALIDRFASDIAARGGRVTDVGSGTGRVTAYLSDRGLEIDGIDLSPGMVEVAATAHPSLSFAVGTIFDLPIADGARAGLIAWYSTIHTPIGQLPEVYREFARVLAPGGLLLLGFQAGRGSLHITHSYGHDVDLDVELFDTAEVAAMLEDAGFELNATLVRAPVDHEKRPQGFVLATKNS